MIKVKNITKKYKNKSISRKKYVKYALDDVSIEIHTGSVTAIIGINGSGKTTLLKSISGLVHPDSGEIFIDGEKIGSKVNRDLIFVPDVATHFAGFSIGQMMEFYRDFYENWCDEKAKEMLEFFNLKEDEIIDNLSKGNIAKTKLVFAFSMNTKYIVLDEPFSGIDIFKREEFSKVMAKYMNEDQAIILSTHEIDEIESMVEYVYIMGNGRIISNFDAEDMRFNEGKSISDKMREVSSYGKDS
ncbi:ABC transporter ATP-binding protein [Peptostreptococcus faecalis]|uniref:ABC transporter ATP-binding protein n=1 Tax=Peptostreptococcus faecalis TaxID=2045015 RepID=UPI000C7D33FD|nr:ABC transporter ATP-binding protein [Peptostreptococcus faecalis]